MSSEHPHALLHRVVLASIDPAEGCAVNRSFAPQLGCVAPGFGASDCREGCESHLFLVGGLERR